MSKIDVYPVGVLSALLSDWRAWRHMRRRPTRLPYEVRYVWHQARTGNWRAVKSHFNGYLAEPVPLPDGLARCGSGWTRRRAIANLNRHLARIGEDT